MRCIVASLIVLAAFPQLALADPIGLRTTAFTESYNPLPNGEPEVLPSCNVVGTTIATCDLVVPFGADVHWLWDRILDSICTGNGSVRIAAWRRVGNARGRRWNPPGLRLDRDC